MEPTPIGPLERPLAPAPVGGGGGRRGKGAFDDLLRRDTEASRDEEDPRGAERRPAEPLQRGRRFVRRDDRSGSTHVDVMA